MEYKINILFCILLFSGYSLTYKHSHGSKYKPRIYPNDDEVVVNANNNLKLRCEGKEPVKWTFPNNTVDYNYWSTVDVSTSETPDAEYIYGALLSLQNASYVDTGFYYCHSNRTEKDDYLRSNKIYVYVRDNTHLAVPNEQSSFLTVVQNTNTTLPCLPTSPDVIVSLKFNSEPVDAISYDPKVGFLLEIKSLVQSGFYTCNFTLNKQEEEQHFQLNVDSKTDYVSKPHIGSPNNGRTAVGQEYILNCTIRVDLDVYFTLNWTIPNKSGLETGRITSTTVTITKDNYGKVGTIMLIIKNVEYEDMGEYECIVTDHSGNTNNAKKEIIVYEQGESYINLTEKFGVYHISAMAGDPIVQWMINVDAFPEPQLTWHDNFDHEIEAGWSDSKSSKYTVVTSPTEALLKIHQINLNDSGIYRLIAANDFSEKSLNLTLTVNDKPTVHIVTDDYHKYGEDSNLICKAAGYPLPSVDWWFKPCQDGNCTFSQLFTNRTEINGLSTVSYLNITALSSGYVKCIAKNIEGEDSNTVGFYVTDINNGFDVWGIQDGAKVAVNETIIVHCAASVYNYTNNIYWYRWDDIENPKLIETDNQFNIEKKTTNYTHQISMTIRSISYDESGKYGCKVESKDRDLGDDYIVLSIIVTDPRKPKILRSNMNDTEIKITAGKPLEWYCDADGIPVPTISWTKNNEDWSKNIDYDRVKLDNDNRRLRFAYLLDDDEGLYSCRATNREGTDERKMQLIISSKSGITTTVIIIAISIVIVAILCTILLFKIKKEKKLKHELKVAGLNNFEKGDLDGINPELGVDDQAELLPYDKKWEFPRNKLKLGKQLGSGAFGVVMKADAFGIAEGETISTVAVKMVKRNADYTYIRALASELKIMVHLGKHLNVVNLLGACTKNVTKRELLVIVEYCRFGNLHNYLFRHRVDFVNQINPKTGNIDTTIGADILNRTLSVGSNHSDSARIPCAGVDYRATPNPSFSGTDSSAICTPPTGDDSVILSNNSVQPEWRSNYRGDYKGNVRPISTHDLLCWAFQVARGMDYLASRKVLHGDLAARNILLAEDNIVKICDFGLAKSMYKSDNYKKKGDGPLPVKWMSVESIRDRVFSTQSDVWSYGIVLWEFFSLARTPYPGMDADERLYNKLVDGYRMDQPEYATKEIYQTMLDCWHAKPTMRPSFTELSENLGCMLQESVRKHYIDLNDPYIHMNNERLGEGQSDYLAMLCSPDYGNLTSPTHNYVNDNISPPVTEQTGESSGYLPMDIFSPTNSNDNSVFDFDFHKKQKQNGEKASGIELMPILHPHVESDSEISPTMPSPSKSFTNPSYQTAPNIDSIIEIEPKNEQIIPTPDNYINMPQHKMKSDTKQNLDCFSNPSYVQMNNKKTTDNEKSLNYINSQSRDWERPYL